MKKINKKAVLALTIALISSVMLMALQANAVSDVKIDNIEYSSTDISAEKLEQIIKMMYGIYANTESTSRSILCIFGHSIQTGGVCATEHNYYSTAPRCKETNIKVEYCTRNSCNYFITTGQSISRVGCH